MPRVFSNNHPQDIQRKKTGPNQSHEFGFGETAVIFTTEPFGLLPGRMYLAEITSDLRPRGALPGGFWILFITRFFFGGLFLVGHGIATSGWWFPGGWCCLPGELELWVFWRVFSNLGDVWPICLTMPSSSLTTTASWDLWWIHPAKLLINTSCLRSINCSTRRPFCWQISAFPLTVLLFRWRCCWWLQRKKARKKPWKSKSTIKETFCEFAPGYVWKAQRQKIQPKHRASGEFFLMANFFRTRLRDSLRNGDAWGLSQNWQPCRRCHWEERICFPIFSSFDYPGFSRPSKSIKRIVFVRIVDEVNPQKCPGIPGEVKRSIAKIIVFLQLVVMKWIPTSKSWSF